MNLSQDLLEQGRSSTRKVKEGLFLSDGLDPFIWLELGGGGRGLLNEWRVWIRGERSGKGTHVFDNSFPQVVRFSR